MGLVRPMNGVVRPMMNGVGRPMINGVCYAYDEWGWLIL